VDDVGSELLPVTVVAVAQVFACTNGFKTADAIATRVSRISR
jgi:hypothetical protein